MKKKPTKLDRVAEGYAQDFAHASTDAIARERSVLACKSDVLSDEAAQLQGRLATVRSELAVTEAKLRGLASVVGRR